MERAGPHGACRSASRERNAVRRGAAGTQHRRSTDLRHDALSTERLARRALRMVPGGWVRGSEGTALAAASATCEAQ